MSSGSFFVILLSLSLSRLVYTDCPDSTGDLQDEMRLHTDLSSCVPSSDYRPVKDHKKTVHVGVQFYLRYMTFDAEEEKVTIHSLVRLTWIDEYLTWTPSDYGNIENIVFESQEMWTPRMALFNADASLYPYDQIDTACLLNNTGSVSCVPHLAHTAICRTALSHWPYDEQNCTLYFGSWMHTGEQVNFTFASNNPVVLDDFQNAPGWKLVRVIHDRLPGTYSCCPGSTYPMLQYTFVLQREAAGIAAIIVIPSIVIVLLTLLSILLDVKDNTRLVMICFSLFGHFIFSTEIGYVIPKLSAETPIILLFIRDSMIVTLVGVLETLFLMYLRRRTVPAPSWVLSVNRFVTIGPGKYVVFTEFDPCEGETGKVITEDSGNDSNNKNQIHTDWIKLANLLNSCLFIISFLIYLILISIYIPTGN